jgi:hypothetical protein
MEGAYHRLLIIHVTVPYPSEPSLHHDVAYNGPPTTRVFLFDNSRYFKLAFAKMAPPAELVQLDETAIPGTVHLVDVEGILRAKHASGRNADVILVPAPSNDPDDPLNWSPRRKLISTLSLSTYTLVCIHLPEKMSRRQDTRLHVNWKDGRNRFGGDLFHFDSNITGYWLNAWRPGNLFAPQNHLATANKSARMLARGTCFCSLDGVV